MMVRYVVLCIIYTCISIATIYIISQIFYHLLCSKENVPSAGKEETQISSTSPSTPVSSKSKSTSSVSHTDFKDTRRAKKSQPTVSKFFKYSTTICVTLFGTICLLVNIHPFMGLIDSTYNSSNLLFGSITGAGFSLWFIGHIVLTLIFIGRLYFTFKSSVYKFSNVTMNAYIFCWFLMPFFAMLAVLSFALNKILPIIFGSVFVLIDIMLSIALLYSYLKKLFELVSAANDESLSTLMRKYTLIYIISFISTFIVFVALAISPIIGLSARYQEMLWIFLLIDCLMNVYCLWLKFQFAQKHYNRYCKLLDNKCEICCGICAKTENPKLTKDETMIVEIQCQSDSSNNTKITAIIN